MDVSETLCSVLDSLLELKKHTPRTILIDFVTGKESEEILDRNLDELEMFGCGDTSDESIYVPLIDKAIISGFIKHHDNGLTVTAKGKKFLKKPTPFILQEDDDAEEEPNISTGNNSADNALIDSFIESAVSDKNNDVISKSRKSQKRMHLIQAIDRKVALDYYAEQEGMEFDELMNELERIIKSKTKLDITYFGNEVIGRENLNELLDYFDDIGDDFKNILEEFGDVYSEEELRLARIIWLAK